MIYYGGNDYRDYLAHHGVLGMHWGIRRYQPYSVKPRGSGKTGKEIGEARSYGESNGSGKRKSGYVYADDIYERAEKARAKGRFAKADRLERKATAETERGNDASNKKAAQYFKQHEIEDTKENRDKFEQLQNDIDKANEAYRNYLSVLKENDAAVKRGVASAEHNIYKDELFRAKDRLNSWQLHASYETAKYNNKIKYTYDYDNTSPRDIKYDLEHHGVALTPKNIEAYTAAKEKAKIALEKYDSYWRYGDDSKELDRLRREYDRAEKARKNLLKSSSSKASENSTYGSFRKDTKSSASATKQQRSRARALKSSGYSYAEIAKRLGISEGAVSYYLNS